jgi:hypothetical protein
MGEALWLGTRSLFVVVLKSLTYLKLEPLRVESFQGLLSIVHGNVIPTADHHNIIHSPLEST